jgi:CelD/BcsL family acetyltransferase involved in cellulose biosynthesis
VLLETVSALTVTTATTIRVLEQLAPEWHELWRHDPRATVFQSPEWLIPWARHFTAGEFCCACVRADEQLVACIPTFTWRNPQTSQRELLLLGTGISDYNDGVFATDHANDSARVALVWLRERDDWDVLNFEQLPLDSPLAMESECLQEQSICPVLDLPHTVEELAEVIPRAQMQNVSYYRRRANNIGEMRFEIADQRSLDAMLDELLVLHAARWNEVGHRGALSEQSVRAFHREAAHGLLRCGALRLYRMTIRGETATVLYAFASHRCTYYYLSGFDPKFASISPGNLIVGHAIEQAAREGCTRFDFLRGTEKYKYLWGAKDTRTFRRVEHRRANVEY